MIQSSVPEEQLRHLLARDSLSAVQAIPSIHSLSVCAAAEGPYPELLKRRNLLSERNRIRIARFSRVFISYYIICSPLYGARAIENVVC